MDNVLHNNIHTVIPGHWIDFALVIQHFAFTFNISTERMLHCIYIVTNTQLQGIEFCPCWLSI